MHEEGCSTSHRGGRGSVCPALNFGLFNFKKPAAQFNYLLAVTSYSADAVCCLMSLAREIELMSDLKHCVSHLLLHLV